MRESFRALEDQLAVGYDMVFIARSTICDLKCADVKKGIEAAIRKSNMKKEN